MKKEEVCSVMSKFGFTNERVTTTGETFQIGYWEYPQTNRGGERLALSVSCCYNTKSPHCLPVLWYKAGYTDRVILDYFCVDTAVYDKDGFCYRKYDFSKLSEDGKRRVVDFDWVLELSKENLEKLIREVLRRFNKAK
jgi:hypothetical protein